MNFSELKKLKAEYQKHYRKIVLDFVSTRPEAKKVLEEIEATEHEYDGWLPIITAICELGYGQEYRNAIRHRIYAIEKKGGLELRDLVARDTCDQGRVMKHVYFPDLADALLKYIEDAETQDEIHLRV